VIPGQVAAARPVHRQRAALAAEPVEEDARYAERIELQQVLERHRLRHLERPPQLFRAVADLGRGELDGEPFTRRRVEKEDRLGKELAQQLFGLAETRLDGAEEVGRGRHPRREVVRQGFVRIERRVLGDADADHEVVDVAELLQGLAKGDDPRILGRQEVEHVGIEAQPERQRRAAGDDQEEHQKNQAVAPPGEEDQAFERPALAQADSRDGGGEGGSGAEADPPIWRQ
jgi:hypothetical protein